MKSAIDPRHNARRLALTSIFCWLFSEVDEDACKDLGGILLSSERADDKLFETIVSGVKKHNEEINSIIEECAPEWPLDKISKVDLVILRIAIFELLYNTKAPTKVVIDEAVEMAKEFGSETSSKFVNGVLGTVVDKYKGEDKEKVDTLTEREEI